MSGKDFYNWFSNNSRGCKRCYSGIMSNYRYIIPDDKEEMIYDFYALSNLSGGILPGLPEPKAESTRYYGEELEHIRQEILGELTIYLVKDLREALLFAIAAEFRHIRDIKELSYLADFARKHMGLDAVKFIDIYVKEYEEAYIGGKVVRPLDELNSHRYQKDDNRDYINSYRAMMAALKDVNWLDLNGNIDNLRGEDSFTKLDLLDICIMFFSHGDIWDQNFGGEAWANIGRACKALYEIDVESISEEKNLERMTLIDYVYHLQHNSDVVFNKLRSYYKRGYKWISRGLNFRANLRNFYELVDKCSYSLRRFLYAMIKDIYGVSVEEFEKVQERWVRDSSEIEEEEEEEEEEIDREIWQVSYGDNEDEVNNWVKEYTDLIKEYTDLIVCLDKGDARLFADKLWNYGQVNASYDEFIDYVKSFLIYIDANFGNLSDKGKVLNILKRFYKYLPWNIKSDSVLMEFLKDLYKKYIELDWRAYEECPIFDIRNDKEVIELYNRVKGRVEADEAGREVI